jgi:hypothetical protein
MKPVIRSTVRVLGRSKRVLCIETCFPTSSNDQRYSPYIKRGGVEGEILSALGTGATGGEEAMGSDRTYYHIASINHKNNHDRPRQAWVAMSRPLIAALLNRGLIYLQLLSVAVNHEIKLGGRS